MYQNNSNSALFLFAQFGSDIIILIQLMMRRLPIKNRQEWIDLVYIECNKMLKRNEIDRTEIERIEEEAFENEYMTKGLAEYKSVFINNVCDFLYQGDAGYLGREWSKETEETMTPQPIYEQLLHIEAFGAPDVVVEGAGIMDKEMASEMAEETIKQMPKSIAKELTEANNIGETDRKETKEISVAEMAKTMQVKDIMVCKKCHQGGERVTFTTAQWRAGDESCTIIFFCSKCKISWTR